MSNPIFDRVNKDIYSGAATGRTGESTLSAEALEQRFNAPSATAAEMGRLTRNDVVNRGFVLFGLMLISAMATWFVLPDALTPTALVGGIVLTLGLGVVIAFKKAISVPLILAFAVFEGVLVGAISDIYSQAYDGVVPIAIVATLSVCAAMFFGYKTGAIRVTSKSKRIFLFALGGYFLFAMANLIAAWGFGASGGWGFFAFGSPMSIGISLFAVGLASYSFAVDIDAIEQAVAAQVPEKYSWLLAHGLLVTVVWLYLEMLRLIAQLASNR